MLLKKDLHGKFLALTKIEFMRHLKKVDSRAFYDLVYLNVAHKDMNKVPSRAIFDYFFIRTNCRVCNRRTKWHANLKRYLSFCSLKCKSKWNSVNNKYKRYEEGDLPAIRAGIKFKGSHPKAHAKMKANYYTKGYTVIRREFLAKYDVFNKYRIGKYSTRKFFLFLYGRSGIKFCKFCSKPTTWHPTLRYFRDYCSYSCSNSDLRHKRSHGNMNSSR